MGWRPGSGGGSGGAPSGPAGGDLGGTYPNPNVAAVHETSGPTKLAIGAIADGSFAKRVGATLVGGTPSSAPTGAAGGDLDGTYPNPSVAAITETDGPDQLAIGAILDGQTLKRSGGEIVGFGGTVLQAIYTGDPVTILDAGNSNLTWDTKVSGDAVFDLVDPLQPVALVAGIYVIALTARGLAMTPGGLFEVDFNAASSPVGLGVVTESRSATVAIPDVFVGLTLAAKLDVGDSVFALIQNHDGASAIDFELTQASVLVIPL